MPQILKDVLAVIAGLVIGSVVNMAIVTIGPMLIPVPEGVDMSDMDKLEENLKLLKPANFIAPWLAHALGTLAGAFVAAKIAMRHRMGVAIVVAFFFLAGGISMVMLIGGPVWFIAADLVGAYLPMGYLGAMMAGQVNTKDE